MKYVKAFKWLAVILVIAVMITAIGCGKKEAQKATPTPTLTPTPTATVPSEPTGETGTLSSLTGNVTVMRQGTIVWIAATSGMKIGTGYGLKTGSDGHVLITFFDGSVMEIQADTEISVEELSAASGGSTTVHVNQVIGNTLNRVKNLVDSSSTYEVETPAGSAVVRGTIEGIHVDGTGRTCTDVQNENDAAKHSAEFTGSGVTVNILEGMTACCEPGGVPGTPFYTDPADDPNQYNTGDGGGGGGYQPTPDRHCYTCPTYDYGPFTPSYNEQTVSDSFTAGGCRWYLFHLTAGHHYCFSTCEDEGLCLGDAIIRFYNASNCQEMQCSTCGNCGGGGCFFDLSCDATGDYLVQVQGEDIDAALSYTLKYQDCSAP